MLQPKDQKNLIVSSATKDMDQWDLTLLKVIQIGTTTLKNNLALSGKVEHWLTLAYNNSIPGYIP